MNDIQYYRLYNNLQKKHERLSYKIVLKAFKRIFTDASHDYSLKPETPINLLVKEADTLKFLTEIYLSVGIEMAKLVDKSLSKYKSTKTDYQVKASKPKEYKPTGDNPNNVNIWRSEFIRLTQTKEIAGKVTAVTNTTKEQIRKIIQRGVEEKLSHKKVASLILQETDSIKTKQRALTISRTENAVGSNLSGMAQSKASGLVLYKKWIARKIDGKTRDTHAAMVDSEPVPIDALFKVGDSEMAHPCDGSHGAGAGEIVNCRCIISFIPASQVVGKNIRKPSPIKPLPLKPIQQQFDFSKPIPLDFTDLNVFKPASTISEAEKFVIDRGIAKEVNYAWAKDIRVANEFNRVLFELKKQYEFSTLETLGGKTKGQNALMSANWKTLNVKQSYWKTEKMIHANFERDGLTFKERTENALVILRNNYQRNPSIKYVRLIKEYEEKLKYSRFTVEYGKEKYLETTIQHEFGHVLNDSLTGNINGIRALNNARATNQAYINVARELNAEHVKLFSQAKLNGDIYKVSVYGASNSKEFFAETFVMYCQKDPALPVYIKEFFDKYFKITKI